VTNGKWQKGDQVTQLQMQDKDNVVMRRRTVTEGGKLSGAAHDADEDRIYGAAPTYEQKVAAQKRAQ